MTDAPLTQSSGPSELLPPWGGRPRLLEQGCGVAAAQAALDPTETAPEPAQEQQHPDRRHLLNEESAAAWMPDRARLWAQLPLLWQKASVS